MQKTIKNTHMKNLSLLLIAFLALLVHSCKSKETSKEQKEEAKAGLQQLLAGRLFICSCGR